MEADRGRAVFSPAGPPKQDQGSHGGSTPDMLGLGSLSTLCNSDCTALSLEAHVLKDKCATGGIL